MLPYLFLVTAVIFEVFAAAMLKYSNGFTKWLPAAGTIAGYTITFYCLSITMKSIPLSIVYATWSGLGIMLTALAGVLLFREKISQQGAASKALQALACYLWGLCC